VFERRNLVLLFLFLSIRKNLKLIWKCSREGIWCCYFCFSRFEKIPSWFGSVREKEFGVVIFVSLRLKKKSELIWMCSREEFPCCYFCVSPVDKKIRVDLEVFERKNSMFLIFVSLRMTKKSEVDLEVFERKNSMFLIFGSLRLTKNFELIWMCSREEFQGCYFWVSRFNKKNPSWFGCVREKDYHVFIFGSLSVQ